MFPVLKPGNETVKPIEICQHLGAQHVDAFYQELSGKEVRAVLKAGGSHAGVPATAYTRTARLTAWRKRFDTEFQNGNDQLALAFLIEWLMRHHRSMLMDYLDELGVTHRQGETDEDFCETKSPEELRAAIDKLLEKYPKHHVGVYLLLVGHLQESPIFDQTPKVLECVGMSSAEANAYAERHKQEYVPPATKNKGAA